MEQNILLKEIWFKTSRSGGKGGQHVNKTESRVQLNFDINTSRGLTEKEKYMLSLKLKNKISSDGILQLVSQAGRSQLFNKEIITEKFIRLIKESLKPVKRRKKTKISKSAKEKRLKKKKIHSEKKTLRGKKFD